MILSERSERAQLVPNRCVFYLSSVRLQYGLRLAENGSPLQQCACSCAVRTIIGCAALSRDSRGQRPNSATTRAAQERRLRARPPALEVRREVRLGGGSRGAVLLQRALSILLGPLRNVPVGELGRVEPLADTFGRVCRPAPCRPTLGARHAVAGPLARGAHARLASRMCRGCHPRRFCRGDDLRQVHARRSEGRQCRQHEDEQEVRAGSGQQPWREGKPQAAAGRWQTRDAFICCWFIGRCWCWWTLLLSLPRHIAADRRQAARGREKRLRVAARRGRAYLVRGLRAGSKGMCFRVVMSLLKAAMLHEVGLYFIQSNCIHIMVNV